LYHSDFKIQKHKNKKKNENVILLLDNFLRKEYNGHRLVV